MNKLNKLITILLKKTVHNKLDTKVNFIKVQSTTGLVTKT